MPVVSARRENKYLTISERLAKYDFPMPASTLYSLPILRLLESYERTLPIESKLRKSIHK